MLLWREYWVFFREKYEGFICKKFGLKILYEFFENHFKGKLNDKAFKSFQT